MCLYLSISIELCTYSLYLSVIINIYLYLSISIYICLYLSLCIYLYLSLSVYLSKPWVCPCVKLVISIPLSFLQRLGIWGKGQLRDRQKFPWHCRGKSQDGQPLLWVIVNYRIFILSGQRPLCCPFHAIHPIGFLVDLCPTLVHFRRVSLDSFYRSLFEILPWNSCFKMLQS